jgi:hypothetical protein
MESDHDEDSSSDDLEESSDGELPDPSSKYRMKHARTQDSAQYTSTSAGIEVDIHDPPPPYEQ